MKLGLQLPTDPRWADLTAISIEDILVDHAFCEQKAASSCISLIVRYSDEEAIVEALTPIVAEEWGHFKKVVKELKRRGFKLGRQRKDEYVNRLPGILKKGGSRNAQLVEQLLMAGLIEARSCERFRALWLNHPEEYLRNFYYDFMVSEAGHYKTFLNLAKQYLSESEVQKRWKEILDAEAEIMQGLEVRGDRIH